MIERSTTVNARPSDRVPASVGFGLVIVSALLGILVAMAHRIARAGA